MQLYDSDVEFNQPIARMHGLFGSYRVRTATEPGTSHSLLFRRGKFVTCFLFVSIFAAS